MAWWMRLEVVWCGTSDWCQCFQCMSAACSCSIKAGCTFWHISDLLSVSVCTCLSFLSPTVGHWQPHVCKVGEDVATQTLLLEGPLGFSGLVDEVGGGMVRHG